VVRIDDVVTDLEVTPEILELEAGTGLPVSFTYFWNRLPPWLGSTPFRRRSHLRISFEDVDLTNAVEALPDIGGAGLPDALDIGQL
jgi:hypothetical protein